jgi:hypothetical protein
MKIYRGPSSKPFSDESHELVYTTDLAKVTKLWHDSVVFQANITKEPVERQSLAHVVLNSEDVLTLHSTLITGLLARSANLEKMERKIDKVKQNLYSMYETLEPLGSGDSENDLKRQLLLDVIGMAIEELNS